MNVGDAQGNTALHVAAQRSLPVAVEALLSAGASPSVKNLQENTPLHQVVSRPVSSSEAEGERSRKTINLLLRPELMKDFPLNKQGDSILVKAVHQGNTDGAQVILDWLLQQFKEGTVTAEQVQSLATTKNQKGFNPLHEAAIWAKPDLLSLLLGAKCGDLTLFDINAVDAQGNTALILCGDRRLTGIPGTALDHVQLLLRHGIPINAQNHAGDSAIHIPHISVEFLTLLLDHGADVTLTNTKNETPLLAQLTGGRAHNVDRILQHMLAKSISIESAKEKIVAARDQHGNTLAHLLAKIDSSKIGVVPPELFSVLNSDNESPLQVAIEEKALTVLTTLVKTASVSELDAVKSVRDSQGNSLLHSAVEMDYLDGVIALLDHVKMDVNTPNADMDEFSDGGLPIHLAAMRGSMTVLPVLLSHGAQVDSQANPAQDTPLHLAIRFNHYEAAQALLEKGASKTLKNRDGNAAPEEVLTLKGIDDRFRELFAEES